MVSTPFFHLEVFKMKLSELIEALTSAKEQFGDLEVLMEDTEGMDNLFLITNISHRTVPNVHRDPQEVIVLE